MNIIKRKIRKLSLWLHRTTDLWIVPEEFWDMVDEELYITAGFMLDELREENPNDPEITYADALLNRLILVDPD